jgi:hypothetical protein
MKITIAKTTEINKFQPHVDQLLRLISVYVSLDLSDVFVSDQSSFWDFGLSKGQLEKISDELGFHVTEDVYLADVARKIEKELFRAALERRKRQLCKIKL